MKRRENALLAIITPPSRIAPDSSPAPGRSSRPSTRMRWLIASCGWGWAICTSMSPLQSAQPFQVFTRFTAAVIDLLWRQRMGAERIGENARLVIDLKLEPREPRLLGRVSADGVRGIVKRLDLRDRDARADNREHQADRAELCTMENEHRKRHHHRRGDQPELWIDREVRMRVAMPRIKPIAATRAGRCADAETSRRIGWSCPGTEMYRRDYRACARLRNLFCQDRSAPGLALLPAIVIPSVPARDLRRRTVLDNPRSLAGTLGITFICTVISQE